MRRFRLENQYPPPAARQAGSPLSVISLPPLETPNDFSPDLSQQLLAVLAVFDRVWAGGGKNDGRIFQFRLDGGMVIRVSNRRVNNFCSILYIKKVLRNYFRSRSKYKMLGKRIAVCSTMFLPLRRYKQRSRPKERNTCSNSWREIHKVFSPSALLPFPLPASESSSSIFSKSWTKHEARQGRMQKKRERTDRYIFQASARNE